MLAAALAPFACQTSSPGDAPPAARSTRAVPLLSLAPPASPAPASSELVELERAIQASKLQLAPERTREPRLAFGSGVLGQLTTDELRLFDAADGSLLASHALQGARLVVTLADGGLLAVGSGAMLRFDPYNKRVSTLAKPVLLPGSELHADALVPDRIWVFDPEHRAQGAAPRPVLSSMLLDPKRSGLLLPDRTIELEQPSGGVLGTTREGVWLYLSGRSAERFGPGGARLARLALPEQQDLLWVLPARRLDQCFVFDEKGGVSRAVVTPSYRRLSSVQLSGLPLAAAVADEGRLLAEGPRFELHLLDAELQPVARVDLPSVAPTGGEDWVKVVTRNQRLATAARAPRVAVGGPDRVSVFDAQGKLVFSIPSR